MKKLLLIMLAALFMLASCDLLPADDGTTSNNDYTGTWKYISQYDEDETKTYVFTESNYTLTETDSESLKTFKGELSIDGNELTLTHTSLEIPVYDSDGEISTTTSYTGAELTSYMEGEENLTTTLIYTAEEDTLLLVKHNIYEDEYVADDSTTADSYIGTWVDEYIDDNYTEDNYTETYIFTEDSFESTYTDDDGTDTNKGTVSVDGKKLTLTLTYHNDGETTYEGDDLSTYYTSIGLDDSYLVTEKTYSIYDRILTLKTDQELKLAFTRE